MRDLPQHRIQMPPYLVGGVIPRRTHIQGEFGQGIETLYVRARKLLLGVNVSCRFAHGFSFIFFAGAISGCCVCASSAAPTMVCSSSRMRRRMIRSAEPRWPEVPNA